MKGVTLLEALYMLGISPSGSRPRVSNDNPYVESIFRTCKYPPSYSVSGFANITEAREWYLLSYIGIIMNIVNSGLNFLTPIQCHNGNSEIILKQRKQLYEKAKANHPERWSRQTRDLTLDKEVWLNPERSKLPSEVSIAT